ncbi:MAG: hypothetical protein C5B52_19405 [Bacteroidetes bacterium]|nr:MAG: hypothetical protein C5B52_19405 [Bacteroidota bacterium]
MKRVLSLALASALLVSAINACGQEDKSKRPSPPAKASEKIASGATVTIDYSKPSLKGRTIGKDLEPMDGKVWRTGANEATVFTVDKDVKVEGKPLPAGKYGLFTISGPNEWTIIFNKTWNQWGAFNYKEADDVLRVKVKPGKAPSTTEQFTINIAKSGKVSLLWGDKQVDFNVQ